MQTKINTRTRITRNCEIRLTGADLREAVNQELKAQGHGAIPEDAAIEFFVPGGADWSSTAIDIDERNPVIISWTEEEADGD